jgi:pilus assembly protein CpaB
VAYTIQISDVSGVGGFARPGDVVDVLLTRNMPGENAGPADKMNDVVLHAVPLLGIDLVADESKSQPAVGKTATLQVSPTDAQKLALASQIGILSLALRNLADKTELAAATVLPRDLSAGRVPLRGPTLALAGQPSSPAAAAARVMNRTMMPRRPSAPRRAAPPKPAAAPAPTMTIIRGTTPTEYEVRRGR